MHKIKISEAKPVAKLALMAMPSATELAEKVDFHLRRLYKDLYGEEQESFLVEVSCPRFQSGDGKGIVQQSVRGLDLFLLTDVGNYNLQYKMFGQTVPMSPDDHYADLKRAISACMGKQHRLTVIMPLLYGARQHRRSYRESLDCAMALQELNALGVSSITTFDAHDPRVQNAIPNSTFDNIMPHYQTLKALVRNVPDIVFDKDHLMVVSPDEGAMARNVFYASLLGLDLGMYYKRRDYSRIVNGRNPIVAHEFLGSNVDGKDVFVYDDMIASGESMLDLAKDMHSRGAKRIFAACTFGLFTEGIDKFQKAYEQGYLTGVLSTNLTYRRPELLEAPWYYEVDCSKYVAYYIASLNHDISVSSMLDPVAKIQALLEKHEKEQAQQLRIED